jgi:hypothetical protein
MSIDQRWRIWRDAFGGVAVRFRRFGRSSRSGQASLRFASSYRQLLSSPLPQTAKATPHFGNDHVLPSLCCGSARVYGLTYHEPLTFTLLREGYTRLPCAYLSHPSGAQVARGAVSFPIPIQNTHSNSITMASIYRPTLAKASRLLHVTRAAPTISSFQTRGYASPAEGRTAIVTGSARGM